MSKFYKLTAADKLGDPWESHGKEIQTWWCSVDGEELPVSIGKQVGNTLQVGKHLYGDLMKYTSKKGNDYWKFKGSQVPEGVQRPTDNVVDNAPIEARLAALEAVVFPKGDNAPPPTDEDAPVNIDDFTY